MKIFCIIPAYNEKGNLALLIDKLSSTLSKITKFYTIFFVIQGNDGSVELLEKIKGKNKHVDWIHFPNPLGIGTAYKAGFNRIKKGLSYVLTLDADLNHDPTMIPLFIKKMEETKADIVVGSRYIEGGSFNDKRKWKIIISAFVNRLISKILVTGVKDMTSGFRFMKKGAIDKIKDKLQEKGYSGYMELILYAKKLGFDIAEVPITYSPRFWGKSKMGKLRTMIDYLIFLPKAIFDF